jgi:hypothetical protein
MHNVCPRSLKKNQTTKQLFVQILPHQNLKVCLTFYVKLYLSQYKKLQGTRTMRPNLEIS